MPKEVILDRRILLVEAGGSGMEKRLRVYLDRRLVEKLGEEACKAIFKHLESFMLTLPDEELERIRRAGSPELMTWLVLLKFHRSFRETFFALNELVAKEAEKDIPLPKVQERIGGEDGDVDVPKGSEEEPFVKVEAEEVDAVYLLDESASEEALSERYSPEQATKKDGYTVIETKLGTFKVPDVDRASPEEIKEFLLDMYSKLKDKEANPDILLHITPVVETLFSVSKGELPPLSKAKEPDKVIRRALRILNVLFRLDGEVFASLVNHLLLTPPPMHSHWKESYKKFLGAAYLIARTIREESGDDGVMKNLRFLVYGSGKEDPEKRATVVEYSQKPEVTYM